MVADGRYWFFQASCTLPCFLDSRREWVGCRRADADSAAAGSSCCWLSAARSETARLGPPLSGDSESVVGCTTYDIGRQQPQQQIYTHAVESACILQRLAVEFQHLETNNCYYYTVKATKLAYYGHTMRKQGSCLENEITQETMQGARRRERPRTAWMDNVKTWTGLSLEESHSE